MPSARCSFSKRSNTSTDPASSPPRPASTHETATRTRSPQTGALTSDAGSVPTGLGPGPRSASPMGASPARTRSRHFAGAFERQQVSREAARRRPTLRPLVVTTRRRSWWRVAKAAPARRQSGDHRGEGGNDAAVAAPLVGIGRNDQGSWSRARRYIASKNARSVRAVTGRPRTSRRAGASARAPRRSAPGAEPPVHL